MKYASICDGIGAVHAAWQPLGWECDWTSEIEPFPIAVAEHHWGLPNLGDMTKIDGKEATKQYGQLDLICGGTPCQSFSVAGLRKGMDDPRGNLALVYLRLVDTLRPRWIIWENVPGVLSIDGGRAFGSFVKGLAECGYRWACRILDAQYFGLAQRRKRVFVVGYLGDWRRAAAVLFDTESVSGNPAPSRGEGERTTGTLAARTSGGGGLGTDFDLAGGITCIKGAAIGRKPTAGPQCGDFIDDGTSYTLNCTETHAVAFALRKSGGGCPSRSDKTLIPAGGFFSQPTHTLRADGFDASEDGTGRGTPIVPCLVGNGNNGGGGGGGGGGAILVPKNSIGVRRLTPRECERLQGFPDDYTAVMFRNKPAADGPRYRALGNSMAVPVMRWIGERIKMVDGLFARGPCRRGSFS